jgi:hypothetical protein
VRIRGRPDKEEIVDQCYLIELSGMMEMFYD